MFNKKSVDGDFWENFNDCFIFIGREKQTRNNNTSLKLPEVRKEFP